MAAALNPVQREVLRRLRDGEELFAEPWLPGLVAELALLETLRLVHSPAFMMFELTPAGRRYVDTP